MDLFRAIEPEGNTNDVPLRRRRQGGRVLFAARCNLESAARIHERHSCRAIPASVSSSINVSIVALDEYAEEPMVAIQMLCRLLTRRSSTGGAVGLAARFGGT